MEKKKFHQPVTDHPGENVIFIVYKLKNTPDTADKVKDVCSNFTGMIRSMQNRFQESQFSAVMGSGAKAWAKLSP